jgi:hypothetical protein
MFFMSLLRLLFMFLCLCCLKVKAVNSRHKVKIH